MGYIRDTAMSVHDVSRDLRIRLVVRFLSHAIDSPQEARPGSQVCMNGLQLQREDEITGVPRPALLIVGGAQAVRGQDEEEKK